MQRVRRFRFRYLQLSSLSDSRHRGMRARGSVRRARDHRLQSQGRTCARRGDQVPGLQCAQAANRGRCRIDVFRAYGMRRRRPGRAVPAAHARRDPLARFEAYRSVRIHERHEIRCAGRAGRRYRGACAPSGRAHSGRCSRRDRREESRRLLHARAAETGESAGFARANPRQILSRRHDGASRSGSLMQGVTVVDHPLVQHKLTLIRDKNRSTKTFRELLKEIGMLLCYEVTRDLPLTKVEIETPLAPMTGSRIAGKKLVFAPVLRAGLTFVEGMLDLVPAARMAHIGLYREPKTLAAVEYYFKAPSDLAERLVIVVVLILATANTAVAAVDRLKERGAKDIRLVCLISAGEGIERMRGIHPDVPIWTAAIDDALDEQAFIVPGLGDAGDRAYGTK